MAETLQRTLMMGVDETGEPVPMPVREDGNASTVTISDDIGVDILSMPTVTVNVQEGFSRKLLSASTNGKAIKVAATATAGTLLHTATATALQVDCIELWACNTDSTDRLLTIEWGEATAPDGNIVLTIEAQQGLVRITPEGGLFLNNGLTVRAFAATANVITIHGRVETRTLS
jgi:hypothetical protein